MKALKLLLCLLFIPAITFSQELSTYDLTAEHKTNPVGMDVLQPRLSWKIKGTGNNVRQTVYWIRVATDPKFSGSKIVWQSGELASDQSVLVPYKGPDLKPFQKYYWQVRVWDKDGRSSEWSEPAFWSMGLLKPEEWKANWIGAPWQGELPLSRPASPKRPGQVVTPDLSPVDQVPPPAPMMRKAIILNKKIASARAYVTGLGFFEFYVNGKKVSEDVLTPNLTLYGKRDDIGEIAAMTRNNFREYRVM
jgi:alpha-L-rhamnosidase